MDDTKDIKEILEGILLREMHRLDLSFISGAELRRQNLSKATQQLTSIVRTFDKYSSIPEVFEVKLQRIASDINSVWNELNEENVFDDEDDK
tara:strand:- start:68 stop:343 length:276 start_codon:yes stop_codon:yes gene_type:complete